MKGFQRFFQRLVVAVLIAAAWPGGWHTGAGNDHGSAPIQKKLPPGSPEIQSFTASPSRGPQGRSAVLRWVVANAEHIWISRAERLDSADCVKDASGETRVTPETETTYKLHAIGGAVHVVREVTVQVAEPSGSCTISGEISNDKKEYATTVRLFRFESQTPQLSKSVDDLGRFVFSGVAEEATVLSPPENIRRGNWPSDPCRGPCCVVSTEWESSCPV